MGGSLRGHPFNNPNGATISAIDEARCRLIEAEENERKAAEKLGRAYHYVKLANAEVSAAITELACVQQSLGDIELIDRETHRVEGLSVSVQGHPSRLTEALVDAVREKRKTA